MASSRRTSPSRPRVTVRRVYEYFSPISEWIHEDESDFLVIHVPGFQKQNIKITSDEQESTLRVAAERPVAGNKWLWFRKDYRIPEKCNREGIRGKFDKGIFTVTMPRKKKTSSQRQQEEDPENNSPSNKPSKPENVEISFPPKTDAASRTERKTNPEEIVNQKMNPSPPSIIISPTADGNNSEAAEKKNRAWREGRGGETGDLLSRMKEEKELLVNVGAAALVLVLALGWVRLYISHIFLGPR